MNIDDYLIQGENIKDRISVTEQGSVGKNELDWFITSERVIKYGEGKLLRGEELHDLSLDKITGVSFENQRQNALLGVVPIFVVLGLVLLILPEVGISSLVLTASAINLIVGGIFVLLWYFSTTPHLRVRSPDSSEVMTMEVSGGLSSSSSDEVRLFVNTLREEIN